MENLTTIARRIRESMQVKQQILADDQLMASIEAATMHLYNALKEGHRVYFCGNGGSAADAQHLAAELSGKFYLDRPALPAEACHVNTSFVTAVSNDYSFTRAFARYIEGFGKPGDVLVAISTSGNSANILEAISSAKSLNMHVISMTGAAGGKMKEVSDFLINVPSTDTPRIQEAHITIGHIICEIVENKLFA